MKKFVTVLAAMMLFGWGAGAIQAQDWTWQEPVLVETAFLEEIAADPTSNTLYCIDENGSVVTINLTSPAPDCPPSGPVDKSDTVVNEDIVVDPKGQAFVCTEDQVRYHPLDMPLVNQPCVPTKDGVTLPGQYTHITAGYGGKLFVLYQTTPSLPTDPIEQYILVGSPPVITDGVTISFKPRSLNLKSRGRWVSCHIGLPDGYAVGDIDLIKITQISIEGVDQPYMVDNSDSISVDPDAPCEEGHGKLKVKFKRSEVIGAIGKAIEKAIADDVDVGKFVKVTLTVQGGLDSGEYFQGTDTIKVKTGKKKRKK